MFENYKYSRELAKRFISDYKLPMPLINEDIFRYNLNLYEKDFGALSKYVFLMFHIDDKFGGDINKFLEDYYSTRDKIITTIESSSAFQKFNNMDMSVFSYKKTHNITSNNIYNCDNVHKHFISIDLCKANFQALSYVDANIVLNYDTYEDFIGHFTPSYYMKDSKYSRQVIFGKMNPKRHITVEKYLMDKIYHYVQDRYPQLSNPVSVMSDEIVYEVNYDDVVGKLNIEDIKNDIAFDLSLDVKIEFFHLGGAQLYTENCTRSPFFIKSIIDINTERGINQKLVSVPLPYHMIIYKLHNNMPLVPFDYHFDYEGMDCVMNEKFRLKYL